MGCLSAVPLMLSWQLGGVKLNASYKLYICKGGSVNTADVITYAIGLQAMYEQVQHIQFPDQTCL